MAEDDNALLSFGEVLKVIEGAQLLEAQKKDLVTKIYDLDAVTPEIFVNPIGEIEEILEFASDSDDLSERLEEIKNEIKRLKEKDMIPAIIVNAICRELLGLRYHQLSLNERQLIQDRLVDWGFYLDKDEADSYLIEP